MRRKLKRSHFLTCRTPGRQRTQRHQVNLLKTGNHLPIFSSRRHQAWKIKSQTQIEDRKMIKLWIYRGTWVAQVVLGSRPPSGSLLKGESALLLSLSLSAPPHHSLSLCDYHKNFLKKRKESGRLFLFQNATFLLASEI